MKRLLQLVAFTIAAAAVLTPLVEAFDRWDPFVIPVNDTEMRGFCIVLGVCFTLAVVQFFARTLVSSFNSLCFLGLVSVLPCAAVFSDGFASPPAAAANSSPPPLRI